MQSIALDALDKSICAVLGSDHFVGNASSKSVLASNDVRILTNPISLHFLFLDFMSTVLDFFGRGGLGEQLFLFLMSVVIKI